MTLHWIILLAATFAVAITLTALFTPLFRKLARKTNFMDCPADNHKRHKQPTPLLGGVALYLGWLITVIIGIVLINSNILPFYDTTFATHVSGFRMVTPRLIAIVVAATAVSVLGVIDDKYPLTAWCKFLFQIIIAIFAVVYGDIHIRFFINSAIWSTGITVLWIVTLINAINFFDNMDGLAVGSTAIAMLFFTIVSAYNEQFFVACFSALNCGICCGLWFFNASPASIFMGDCGSHLLGFLAAITSIGVTGFNSATNNTKIAALIPLFILAIPLFDTFMVSVIRIYHKTPFWIGDHNHISHRFCNMGLSSKTAVALIHMLGILTGISGLITLWCDYKTAVAMLIQTAVLLVLITIIQFQGLDRR